MSAVEDWSAEFVDLWPTLVVRRRLPDHAGANREIERIAVAMEERDPGVTTRYQGVDFLGLEEPAVRWLREGIDDTVASYLEAQGVRYPVRWTLQAWPNVNRRGDYHAPHNHAWCYLSGTYYVRIPRPEAGPVRETTGHSGAISFYDPRGAATREGAAGALLGPEAWTVRPEPGTLLLWPAGLLHLVHPNLADEPRVTVSFNVVLEWQNHYLSDSSE